MPAEPPWLHPEAIKEARAAREWYLARNAEAGEAFMAELDAAIEQIERGLGSGLRTWAALVAISFTDSPSSSSSAKRTPESRLSP